MTLPNIGSAQPARTLITSWLALNRIDAALE